MSEEELVRVFGYMTTADESRLPDTHTHVWRLHHEPGAAYYICWCGEIETYAEHHRGFGTNVAPGLSRSSS